VTLAAVLLAVMAVVGLGYAVVTLVVTPGVVSRFRTAAAGTDPTAADGYVATLWVGAGIATVLGIILFALYAALALGLRGGSPAARVATWVVCGLGLLAGCGSAIAVAAQRNGSDGSDELLVMLGAAYPGGWIGLNLALSVAQMLGYVVVAVLLAVSPRAYFRRDRASAPPVAWPQPTYPYAAPPVAPPPPPGPDDQYWARPS
jgi:hypothetical protein